MPVLRKGRDKKKEERCREHLRNPEADVFAKDEHNTHGGPTQTHTQIDVERETVMHSQVTASGWRLALGLSPETSGLITKVNTHTHKCTKGFPSAVTAARPVISVR